MKSEAEQKITDSAIASTVTSSKTYTDALGAKASTSDLANYVKATEFSSKISQCSNEILAVVSASGDYYKRQSVVSITPDGITMADGSISLTSSSSFKIASGGSVQITADNTNGSYINFSEAFSASQYALSAKSGDFKTLRVGGRNVLTEDSLVSGTVSKIVVSPNQPSRRGVIWLQPSSVTSVSYSGDSGPNRNGANCISNTSSPSKTLSCLSSDKMPNGTIKYSLTFIVTLVYDNPSSLSDVKLNVTLTKNENASLKVSSMRKYRRYYGFHLGKRCCHDELLFGTKRKTYADCKQYKCVWRGTGVQCLLFTLNERKKTYETN